MNEAKHRFFCANIDSGILSEDESNHALRVLRLKAGMTIQVIDGKGRLCSASIIDENKKGVSFTIQENKQEPLQKFNIHIAISPTKNLDRYAFFIEKATEIGISRITPIITKNSERKELKVDKIQKNLIAAIKQSGNLFLPKIDEPVDIKTFINDFKSATSQKFIAHCQHDSEKSALKNHVPQDKNVIILVGPEGDFTAEEVILAKENNFLPVSLGESRLRTETAGIVACHTVHLI